MKKVLIIEDEKIIRETVAHYFSHDGYEVVIAEDGQIGLESFAAHENDISLVILDIMLPVMDGQFADVFVRTLMFLLSY